MNVLVLGSGGREHAICWSIKKSKLMEDLYCIPGNGGISEVAQCVKMDIGAGGFSEITRFAKDKGVDLIIVGPEGPLVEGIVDYLVNENLSVFGPVQDVAVLEGSKVFAKRFMSRHKIPTPRFEVFEKADDAKEYVRKASFPLVLKADGLCAGKGCLICNTEAEAVSGIDQMMIQKVFGASGEKVIIEDFEEGEEISILVFSDGKSFCEMIPCQDHKRIFDGDKGPNTGGMGAYASKMLLDSDVARSITQEVIEPTFRGIKEEGMSFVGVLYFGLILTAAGPKVLEYNVRFGDPETQAILPLLKDDLLEIVHACTQGRLDACDVKWVDGWAVCVVMASAGYPGQYRVGQEIFGLEEAKKVNNLFVFHAGTKVEDGKMLTSGGRVLGVTAVKNRLRDSVRLAYSGVSMIEFKDAYYRRDIAYRALERL